MKVSKMLYILLLKMWVHCVLPCVLVQCCTASCSRRMLRTFILKADRFCSVVVWGQLTQDSWMCAVRWLLPLPWQNQGESLSSHAIPTVLLLRWEHLGWCRAQCRLSCDALCCFMQSWPQKDRQGLYALNYVTSHHVTFRISSLVDTG